VTAPTVLPPAVPTARRRIGRAILLQCPECGSRGLFRHWLRLQARCPSCALKLDRGRPDHFVGAYLVNLILAELLFGIGLGVWLVAVWPEVPWDRIEGIAVAAMIAAPLIVYPFTRTVWLAADLIFDPPKPGDR
jgi:uncharacterized protein (DUF983 family)